MSEFTIENRAKDSGMDCYAVYSKMAIAAPNKSEAEQHLLNMFQAPRFGLDRGHRIMVQPLDILGSDEQKNMKDGAEALERFERTLRAKLGYVSTHPKGAEPEKYYREILELLEDTREAVKEEFTG